MRARFLTMFGRSDPLRRALSQARFALRWERWAPVLWPPAAALGAYAALALFGLWDATGDPWRAIALAITLILAVLLTIRAWRRAAPVTETVARRRVEDDSAFQARPLEGLEDRAALGENGLWTAHQARLKAMTRQARGRRPRAALAASDPYALRFAVLAALLVAAGIAGDRAAPRLQTAFAPRLEIKAGAGAVIDAWLDPPAYTGVAPIFLTSGENGRAIKAPAGSEFTLRASAARRAPRVMVESDTGTQRLEPEQIETGVFETRTIITEDAEIRAGGRVWRIAALPDEAPQAGLTAAPEATASGALKLAIKASDDHGMTGAALTFALAADTRQVDEADLDMFASPTKSYEGPVEIDLTGHRWAGRQVRLRVAVTDGADQTGYSDWLVTRLPERVFIDPLAKAIVEQRSILLNETRDYAPMPPKARPGEPSLFANDMPERRIERAPRDVRRVTDMLQAVTYGGEDYFSDYAVFLGLAQVRQRLKLSRGMDEVSSLPPELWRIALRAETGDLADAEEALRAAERALMEAMARGAEMSELMQLFEAYQQAVDRYMQALAQNAMENGRFAEAGQASEAMQSTDIQEMLDAIRESAELGATGDASAALQALGEMLRNMQMQLAMGGGGQGEGEMSEQQQRDLEALEDLGDMIGDERGVMDETLREYGESREDARNAGPGSRQPRPMPGQPGLNPLPPEIMEPGEDGAGEEEGEQPGAAPNSALADRQQGIGEALEELRQDLAQNGEGEGLGGESPDEALDRAGEAMRRSEEALRRGAGDEAQEAQEEALGALREGADRLAQRMMERSRQANNGAQGQASEGSDPLGRSSGLSRGGDNVQIPDKADRQRAREILEEIRRRAAERGRPEEELDYYDRLLERF
ncbi:MAG: DUF4175 family protein [Euryhalocaulis sp.]|uniref:DUF4175 domain-containing protein n=2 Tax=Euryhalocaulis TaxID=1712422 RepID=UPI001839503E|nr:DUF4175 family protein [Euryhalocaulis sp.]MBA4800903.1 DUF4175 family protein [Euryhalocaulis sp.]